jgi:probable rRNA maturation factor
MRRIRTADRGRNDARAQGRESVIAVSGRSHPLRRADAVRAALTVLDAERRVAMISISFVGRDAMRALHRRWKGTHSATDVLAFPLSGPDGWLVGDIYICPWQAVRHARALGVPLRRELTRLVVHGVLHVLGYDHPENAGRMESPMWRRQERHLRALR